MLRLFTFILLPILIFTAACGSGESTKAERPEQMTTRRQTLTQRPQPTPATATTTVLIPTPVVAEPVLDQQASEPSAVVIINTVLLNVRQKADTDSPVIATLASGECVPAISQEGGWYALRLTDGRMGWSSADYLVSHSACPTPPPVAQASVVQAVTHSAKGVVTTSVLNVRSGPGDRFGIINQIVQNDCLHVLEAQDGWFHVTNDAGLDGWSSQQFIEITQSCPFVIHLVEAAGVTASLTPTATTSDYRGKPFAPDATVIRDAYIFECFGTGNNELRFVTAGTPLQVLGIGDFAAPYPELGNGPFVKIRIWDGQYGWITAEAVNADMDTLPSLHGQCETYDRIEWSVVAPPIPTEIIPTPTAYPSWMTASPQPQSGGCCKICRKGKACGNSCISVNYTCHKGTGCACNG